MSDNKTCDHSGVEIPIESSKESIDRLDSTIIEQLQRAHKAAMDIELGRSKKLVEALKAVQKQSVAHFEDCVFLVYEDQECDCNADKVELMIYQALKDYEESK